VPRTADAGFVRACRIPWDGRTEERVDAGVSADNDLDDEQAMALAVEAPNCTRLRTH